MLPIEVGISFFLFICWFVSGMCRDQSKSQAASETGTEDWGQEDDATNQQGSNANWSNTTRDDNQAQSPQTNNTQGGDETSTSKPTQGSLSSSGSGEKHKDTMVFSLSRDNDLVTRYTSKRGKARGRGQRSSGGPAHRVGSGGGGFGSSAGDNSPTTPTKTRFAPPKPGSGGITVIEPLEKRLQKQQQDNQEKSTSDGQSMEGSPSSARPMSTSKSTPPAPAATAAASGSGSGSGDTAESASKGDGGGGGGGSGKNRPGSGRSPSTKDGGQPATSKPKRYSSQRQKGGSFTEITILLREIFEGQNFDKYFY